MASKSIAKFAIVILIIAGLVFTAVSGIYVQGKHYFGDVLDKEHGIRRGIDLAGGSELIFEPVKGSKVTQENLESAKEVLRTRLEDMGYTEATTSIQGSQKIRVEIPSETNPEEAEALLGKTAVLTFRDISGVAPETQAAPTTTEETAVEETEEATEEEATEEATEEAAEEETTTETEEQADPTEKADGTAQTAQPTEATEEVAQGEIVLEGSEVKSAKAEFGPLSDGTQGYKVTLKFTPEGQEKFAAATEKIASYGPGANVLAIYLDNTLISAPRVSEKIDSDECFIEGDFTQETAKTLAAQINGGMLPFALECTQKTSIGATLGRDALTNSLYAALIGLILVMLFMIIMYRLCGFVSCISLFAYISLVALAIGAFRLNLTLPGIAGIILTIGTAVDANVIIFERVKEELSNGKTIRAAVDAGFNRAFTAILDSNVTTVIAAAVLWFFGTGTVRSFAETLFIGTIISMFTAIFLTKFLLKQLGGLNIKNPKIYCSYKEVNKNV